jgi:nucleotide-binding universal stress UspA family protein
MKTLERHAEGSAAEEVSRLTHAGFDAWARVVVGKPQREIVNAAVHNAMELVVVGSGSTSWLGNPLLGSVSMHVLHSCPMPVLLAHSARDTADDGTILVAVDGSEMARPAVEETMRLVDRQRCEIRVLSVAPSPEAYLTDVPGVLALTGYDEKLERELVERATDQAEHAAREMRLNGFIAEPLVEAGHPTTQILKQAENLQADLVAVGSRGLGTLRASLLGSVSEHVVRHAPATLVAHGPQL